MKQWVFDYVAKSAMKFEFIVPRCPARAIFAKMQTEKTDILWCGGSEDTSATKPGKICFMELSGDWIIDYTNQQSPEPDWRTVQVDMRL